jgi:hypothetical protein
MPSCIVSQRRFIHSLAKFVIALQPYPMMRFLILFVLGALVLSNASGQVRNVIVRRFTKNVNQILFPGLAPGKHVLVFKDSDSLLVYGLDASMSVAHMGSFRLSEALNLEVRQDDVSLLDAYAHAGGVDFVLRVEKGSEGFWVGKGVFNGHIVLRLNTTTGKSYVREVMPQLTDQEPFLIQSIHIQPRTLEAPAGSDSLNTLPGAWLVMRWKSGGLDVHRITPGGHLQRRYLLASVKHEQTIESQPDATSEFTGTFPSSLALTNRLKALSGGFSSLDTLYTSLQPFFSPSQVIAGPAQLTIIASKAMPDQNWPVYRYVLTATGENTRYELYPSAEIPSGDRGYLMARQVADNLLLILAGNSAAHSLSLIRMGSPGLRTDYMTNGKDTLLLAAAMPPQLYGSEGIRGYKRTADFLHRFWGGKKRQFLAARLMKDRLYAFVGYQDLPQEHNPYYFHHYPGQPGGLPPMPPISAPRFGPAEPGLPGPLGLFDATYGGGYWVAIDTNTLQPRKGLAEIRSAPMYWRLNRNVALRPLGEDDDNLLENFGPVLGKLDGYIYRGRVDEQRTSFRLSRQAE